MRSAFPAPLERSRKCMTAAKRCASASRATESAGELAVTVVSHLSKRGICGNRRHAWGHNRIVIRPIAKEAGCEGKERGDYAARSTVAALRRGNRAAQKRRKKTVFFAWGKGI
jgi:hypothetical protein